MTTRAIAAPIGAKGLVKRFHSIIAVDDISIEVAPGQVYGLIGPDGAGKTTLMRILAGAISPDDGQVNQSASLGYVPQSFSLYTDLTIDENLDFYGMAYGLSSKELATRKNEVLAFADLTQFRSRLAGALSGGMKQRLSLAVALIHQPSALLMDEPTNGVDPVARKQLWKTVRSIASLGTATLVSTQYLEEGEHCDIIGLMKSGKLLITGKPNQIKEELRCNVWELELAGADRFQVSHTLGSIGGIKHIRRFGTTVRFTSILSVSDTQIRQAIRNTNLGELQLNKVEPSLHDVYVWYAGEEVSVGG